ncbi:hypothetical protein PG985_003056 [Apiospora marii]|uniref:uncharacterized protein n=1 Tax=Apiospora marii TaxID=335849 RepID=UPI00313177F8
MRFLSLSLLLESLFFLASWALRQNDKAGRLFGSKTPNRKTDARTYGRQNISVRRGAEGSEDATAFRCSTRRGEGCGGWAGVAAGIPRPNTES